jgi:hypothetical protein
MDWRKVSFLVLIHYLCSSNKRNNNDMMKSIYFSLMLFSVFLFACNSNQASGEKGAEKATQSTDAEPIKTGAYTLTPFTESVSFPDATIESMEYKDSKFTFGVGGDSYKLGVQTTDAPQKNCANSAQGQHIHLIANNLPYAAKYTSEFDYQMPDGEHHILAFLSRSYHESIKTDAAHKAVKVRVANGAFVESVDITAPMLFYSRPKGTYSGEDTKKVMLDFYMVNANMNDFKVKAEINGEEYLLDEWIPYYIEGLPMGDNEIKLTLVDNAGNTVPTPLNPVSRKFKLEGEPEMN